MRPPGAHDLSKMNLVDRTWTALLAFSCCFVLGGCGSTSRALPETGPSGCSSDVDCSGGFCDRTGRCGTVDVNATGRFGTPCTLPPRNPNGTANGEQNTCGSYLCINGRCRSCLEDSECQIEYGAPSCGQILESNRWPGNTCGNYSGAKASAPQRRASQPAPSSESAQRLTVEVVAAYPHSATAYTEGLVFHGGLLWESTGNIGESQLRQLTLETEKPVATVDLAADLFGEGLARWDDRLFQLTLSSGRTLVWDLKSQQHVGDLSYQGEGWGLCHNGTGFVMSNGTRTLQIRDSETFALLREIEVGSNGATPFRFLRLNELECVGGDVLANVFEYRELVRVELATGKVTAIIDTRNLLRHPEVSLEALDNALDLNGIAYVPESDHYLLTGKYWPRLFEVRFVDDPLFR